MNRMLFHVLTLIFVLGLSNAFAKEKDQEDLPSIGDIIGNVLEGDNAYKAYLKILENEKAVCLDNGKKVVPEYVDKESFYQTWNLNCLVVNSSELCQEIKEQDKLICDEPPKKPWYSNIWEKTKSCGAGIKKSWEDYFHFIQSIGHYIINKEVETKNEDGTVTKVGMRDKTNEAISKAWTSMKTYLSTEMTKYQDKYNVSRTSAFFAVTNVMMAKFTKGLNEVIAQAAPKVGCYNYKAKTRVICQVLAEFFAEPIIMFKFIKLGPKALKGTRVAKFFSFHKANASRKVAATTKDITTSASKTLKKVNAPSVKELDFLGKDSKVALEIVKHPDLHSSVVKNQKVFNEIFPDNESRELLDIYLKSTSKQEADELAEVLRVLNEDRAKMTPEQYKGFIDDIKEGIQTSCKN